MRLPSRRIMYAAGAVVLVACIAAMTALNLVVRSEWFLAQVRDKIERGIGRKVSFTSLAPSLWFGVGVRVADFAMYEEDGRTPCLLSDDIVLRVRIIPLLWKSVRMSSVYVARPRISLVRRPDGRWNFEGLFGKRKPARPGEARPRPGKDEPGFRISVASLRVRDGTVTATEPAWGDRLVLRDVNARVRDIAEGTLPYIDVSGTLDGPSIEDIARGVKEIQRLGIGGGRISGPVRLKGWIGEEIQFHGDLIAAGLHLGFGDHYRGPEEGFTIRARVSGAGVPKDNRWDVRSLSAESLGGRLTASGSVLGIGKTPEVRLRVTGASIQWSQMGELKVPGLWLGGTASLDASIAGTREEMSVDCNIDLLESVLYYGERFRKQQGIPAGLTLPLRRSGARYRWDNAVLQLGGAFVSSDGSIDPAPERVLRAGMGSRSLDLAELNRFLDIPARLAGKATMDLVVECPASQPPAVASVTGTVTVSGGEVRFRALRNPVKCDAVITCSPETVRLGMNTVQVGSSLAEGYVSFDLRRWPEFDCEFNCPVMDLADFARAGAEEKKRAAFLLFPFASEAYAAALPADAAPSPLFMRIEGGGLVRIGELRARKLRSSGCHGNLKMSRGIITISDAVLPFYGGTVTGKMAFDLAARPPHYNLESRIQDVGLAKLLSDVYGYADVFSGRLSAECAAAGEGETWESVRKGLRAGGRFSVRDGTLRSFGLFRQLGPLLLLFGERAKVKELASLGGLMSRAPEETVFSRCEGTFLFDGDSYGTGDLVVEIADSENPARIKLEGEMGIGGELNLDGYASFPRGSRCYEALAPYFPDDGGWIELPFPVPIGGTLAGPRIDLEASRDSIVNAAAGIAKLRLRKEIEKKIDKALEPKPKKQGEKMKPEDVGRDLLKGASKELLKQMMQQQ